MMLSVKVYIDDLEERISVAEKLIDVTHKNSNAGESDPDLDISREARGLVFVLLYASYENLLKTLTKGLLEYVNQFDVRFGELKPVFRSLALFPAAQSLRDVPEKLLLQKALPEFIDKSSSELTDWVIDINTFPSNGDSFRFSQIELWCRLFKVEDPGKILKRAGQHVNMVVKNRNAIAHGQMTPEQVGRSYSEDEVRGLIDDWRRAWLDFLDEVSRVSTSSDYFLLK
ncbi:MAE_28990/MAE_18760 family HEPN-like nuclease [Actinomyces naeslundii]|uniref:MAE_28990/MAE_18760 family HEPN-like nuclease n=1 Tax=Actinomyces naeslundii TaxID=1655 RepID=UPI0015B97D5C|nr:MAE_28990/MAE_18760 family HEPN-like nuclease [Actinomyces naeslundii]